MKFPRRQFLHLAAGAAALPGMSRFGWAQAYPSRPITLVVPYAAGGPTDVVARVLADRMRVSLGQPLLIENIVGAGGAIALSRVARAAPDGYTIGIGNIGSHVYLGATYRLDYDLVTDFSPLAQVVTNPALIVTRKGIPANNLIELVAWLKANQDKVSVGTAGVGAGSHIAGVFFQNRIGARFQFVPYRGAGPAMNDMVAGRIDLMADSSPNSLPQLRAGGIKAFAVMSKNRLDAAPDIPTVDEAGLPGLYLAYWHGLWAPKRLPATIVDRLSAAAMEAMDDPQVRARLAELGPQFPPRDQQTPEALLALQKAEIERWWPIIKAAGIKAE
jgi:tripartite-type tricarboxylate transporter receptor subunit TctC